MNVSNRFNNNVVLASDGHQEYVLIGKGIGFKAYPGDLVDMSVVEQTFIPSDAFAAKGIAELVSTTSLEEIKTVQKIINLGEKLLKKRLNPNLNITLLDHLHFALIRFEKEMLTKSPIEWEIKNMYRVETAIGMEALTIIAEELNVDLPKEEAIFIALHFINGQFENESMSDTMDFAETLQQINSIIKYHFQIKLDDQSLNYQRFLTHLRYYLVRQKNHESLDLGNEDVYLTMKDRFPKESNCVNKIAKFIDEKYHWKTTYDEKLYLILHVNRLIH